MSKVEVEITKSFTHTTLGNMTQGATTRVNEATAKNLVDCGVAKYVDEKDAPKEPAKSETAPEETPEDDAETSGDDESGDDKGSKTRKKKKK